MDLSVIIVNYRGWKRLRECLDSLGLQGNSIFTHEVIVVDNNSDDGKMDSFSTDYPNVSFIKSEINGGFAFGCNAGARSSTGRFLLFLNPDTIAGESAVPAMVKRAAETNGDFIISCKQHDDRGLESIASGEFLSPGRLTGILRAVNRFMRRRIRSAKSSAGQNPERPDWVSGSVLMISRAFFNLLGGFDENYWMYFEDMDICRRARDMGAEVLYFTDITVQHKHGGSSRSDIYTTSLTKTEVLISKHLYVGRHFPTAVKFISQFFLVVNNLVSGMLGAVAGLLLFFVPAAYVRVHIFFRLSGYYSGAIKRGSWISPRSVKSNG